MKKTKSVSPTYVKALVLAVSIFAVSLSLSVSASTNTNSDGGQRPPIGQPAVEKEFSKAEIATGAKDAYEKAEKDLKEAKAKVVDLKKLSDAAAKLALAAKTDESKAAAAKAKVDLDLANADVVVKLANVATTKKIMGDAAKVAKTEADQKAAAAVLPDKIVCVGKAVSVREDATYSARLKYTEAVTGAYKARSIAIAEMYKNADTTKFLKDGNKVIWTTFKNSMKDATKTWKTSSVAAWKTYNTSVKECKVTPEFTDAANMALEAKGE